MTNRQIAELAARRWGKTDPSPDDVIARHTPNYGTDAGHTARWHRIAAMAFNMVTEPTYCAHCGARLHGKTNGHRVYCDSVCRSNALKQRTNEPRESSLTAEGS